MKDTRRKRWFSFLLVLVLLLVPVHSCFASATEIDLGVEVTAEAAYIVNTNTGRVVYQKNATKQMYPASCTKIMTAALALEMCPDPKNTIVTVPNGVWNEFDGINISNAGLAGSEEMTMYDLICCMLLQSANEAASTVAHFYGRDDFIAKMNMKAKYLGCTNTNFVNPHGLFDAAHYTTAEDLYKITEWAMTVPYFMEIASMARYTLPETNKHYERDLISTNKMQDPNSGYYTPYIAGIKTGTIDESGRCFVTSAEKDGIGYVAVFLGAPFEVDTRHWSQGNSVFANARITFDWLFKYAAMRKVAPAGTPVTEIPMKYSSEKDYLMLCTETDLSTLVDETSDDLPVLTYETEIPEFIKAPVSEGDVIGSAKVYSDGIYIGTVNLIST
ncbi:MAG: D-alanyl-D-alanine carboxypeptidase, partial [Oscillospiraceae bacterium]|nr:D-alanyl-D-alanine carboxypeptidase [Oscillospiraceae bacterium]